MVDDSDKMKNIFYEALNIEKENKKVLTKSLTKALGFGNQNYSS